MPTSCKHWKNEERRRSYRTSKERQNPPNDQVSRWSKSVGNSSKGKKNQRRKRRRRRNYRIPKNEGLKGTWSTGRSSKNQGWERKGNLKAQRITRKSCRQTSRNWCLKSKKSFWRRRETSTWAWKTRAPEETENHCWSWSCSTYTIPAKAGKFGWIGKNWERRLHEPNPKAKINRSPRKENRRRPQSC